MPWNVRALLLGFCALTLITGAGGGMAACGGDDDGQDGTAEPRTVSFQLRGSGKDKRFSVPKSIPAGVVRIEFTNASQGEGGAQLVRVDAGHTPQQALEAAGAWADRGRPLPPWVHLIGGVGFEPSGVTTSVTQELLPGKHAVFDIESETPAYFDVTGKREAGGLSVPDARIDANEYSFSAVQLARGKNPVLFDNRGREPHVIGAAPIKPGKTIADVRRFALEEKGEDPTVSSGGFETAILEGGTRQVVELDLKRQGNYALLCYVPDRGGGPPHIAKGMISQAGVR